MDRNRDLPRAAMSTVNGLPRRRQRVSTLRDSTDDDTQMELLETLRLRDREQLQKKERDRDFAKRRRVDNRSLVQQRSRSTDSSDEEYLDGGEEARIHQQNRMNQLSPASWSPTDNRRGIRSFRSSPVLRTAVDEVLGVSIPRRSRSASAKKLNEYRNSGNGEFGQYLSHRYFSSSPATASPIGSGGASPTSSGASMKKKMKYVELGTRNLSSASNSKPDSVIQDDIEIEVAEALFDLMKQSHSQSRISEMEGKKNDRYCTDTDDGDLKMLKDERGKDENEVFKFQKEQSIEVNAETNLADSMKEPSKGGRIEKEKFPDNPAEELVTRDGFVDKGTVGSPRESESPSCVKVNACDIQDSTVTNADNAASAVEAKEARIEIDLMAFPSLPPSPERDVLLDIDPKRSETTPTDGIRLPEEKLGVMRDNQLLNFNFENHRHDISGVDESTSRQPSGRKEPKNQCKAPPPCPPKEAPSLLPFPIGMGSWPVVLPQPGYIQSQRAVLSTDGSARSSIMQSPRFRFSQPRRKRCATHQYIAGNIDIHQQLIQKSLSSGPLSFKSILPTQRFITGNPLLGDLERRRNSTVSTGGNGKDKSSDVAADSNATSSKSVSQQASDQTPARNFSHNPGFIFPLGHQHQSTTMAPPVSSGPPHQSASAINNGINSSVKVPSNSSLPEASSSTAGTFNHPFFPSNEAAASYMAILQNSGCPFPIPTNISLPSFKGGSSSMPFLNSSFYSPPVFSIAQNHLMFSSLPSQTSQPSTSTKTSDNNNNGKTYSFPAQPMKNFGPVGNNNNNNNKHGDIPQPFPLSFGTSANFSSMAQYTSMFQMLPGMPWNGNKNLSTTEEKSQTRGSQSQSPSSSAMAPSKFDSLAIPNFYHHQHQKQQPLKASSIQTDYSSFLPKWDNFAPATVALERSSSSSQSPVNIPQLKNSQTQNHSQPVSSLIVGSSSNSSNLKSTSKSQRNVSVVIAKGASTVSVLATQETDGSQKSNPACRRNVPSILSTCTSQVSELK